MKIPKKQKKYCKYCKKYTAQEVALAKKRERGALKRGSISRAKKRGRGTSFGNVGRWGSKPAISKYKRTGAKISKKLDLRYKCAECNKITVQHQGIRMKKGELV